MHICFSFYAQEPSSSISASAPARKRLAFTERAADIFEYPSERFLLNLPADYDFSTLESDCAEAAEREECATRERRARTMAPARACEMTDSLLLEDGDLNVGSPAQPPPPPLLEVGDVPAGEKNEQNGSSFDLSDAAASPSSGRRPVPPNSALNQLNGGKSDFVVEYAVAKPVPEDSFNPDWALSFVDSDLSENENANEEDALSEDETTPTQSGSGSLQRADSNSPAAPIDKDPSLVASPDCNAALIRPLEVDA